MAESRAHIPVDAPFYADVAELGDAAARGAVGREPNRGATPLVRTNSFRGVVGM
jgi:hypothetical protein